MQSHQLAVGLTISYLIPSQTVFIIEILTSGKSLLNSEKVPEFTDSLTTPDTKDPNVL